MFENQRYITKGVSENLSLLLQLFMWQRIDELDVPKDYLQIFKCSMSGTKQKIEHIQEQPEYKREYLLNTDAPVFVYGNFPEGMTQESLSEKSLCATGVKRNASFVGKIFVIDDGTYSTMLLAEEY